jgi:hypothetical protein
VLYISDGVTGACRPLTGRGVENLRKGKIVRDTDIVRHGGGEVKGKKDLRETSRKYPFGNEKDSSEP